jgi:hypothetical protein
VGEATRDLFLSWFPLPGFLQSRLRPAIYALLDDSMLSAFGFPRPPKIVRQLLMVSLKARAFVLRFFPPRKKPFLYVEKRHRAYPRGYTLADIGPSQMVASLNGVADIITEER